MRILITGGAGYIGSMLIKEFLADENISEIISVDIAEQHENQPGGKLWRIKADLVEDNWKKLIDDKTIDIIIHAAYRIRNRPGHIAATEKENLSLSKNTFEFAFSHNVGKLIYLSSVAAYGARPENIGKLLKETDPLKEDRSPYGIQKRKTEEMFNELIDVNHGANTEVIVLRLASVTGPYGQSLSSKFGLITILKKVLPFIIELHPAWARQFIHERDLIEIIHRLVAAEKTPHQVRIYNLAPEEIMTAKDMAKAINKKVVKLPVSLVKAAVTILWPIIGGKLIPPQSINSLVYPINVDGSKIKQIGFAYHYSSKDAFLGKE